MRNSFVYGSILTLAAIAVAAYVAVIFGLIPANADSPPSAAERWMAHTSLRATLRREAPKGPNPVSMNETNMITGIHIYEKNCAVCHGASDGAASSIAVGLYQHAPQLERDGVEDDPEGMTYWKVTHGIRLTGMPSFSHSLNDTQRWQVTLFLKHMNALTPRAKRVWKAVPSVSELK